MGESSKEFRPMTTGEAYGASLETASLMQKGAVINPETGSLNVPQEEIEKIRAEFKRFGSNGAPKETNPDLARVDDEARQAEVLKELINQNRVELSIKDIEQTSPAFAEKLKNYYPAGTYYMVNRHKGQPAHNARWESRDLFQDLYFKGKGKDGDDAFVHSRFDLSDPRLAKLANGLNKYCAECDYPADKRYGYQHQAAVVGGYLETYGGMRFLQRVIADKTGEGFPSTPNWENDFVSVKRKIEAKKASKIT
ncbi:MAG: hypothetical protein P4L74_02010 [Candidatus Doudnabacteria bacterium]|nr:hypothetical protein [Candidatus Doudnabacteria bacterium]